MFTTYLEYIIIYISFFCISDDLLNIINNIRYETNSDTNVFKGLVYSSSMKN